MVTRNVNFKWFSQEDIRQFLNWSLALELRFLLQERSTCNCTILNYLFQNKFASLPNLTTFATDRGISSAG